MKRFQGVDGRVWCSSGSPPAGPVVAEDAVQTRGLRPARPWVHLLEGRALLWGRLTSQLCKEEELEGMSRVGLQCLGAGVWLRVREEGVIRLNRKPSAGLSDPGGWGDTEGQRHGNSLDLRAGKTSRGGTEIQPWTSGRDVGRRG